MTEAIVKAVAALAVLAAVPLAVYLTAKLAAYGYLKGRQQFYQHHRQGGPTDGEEN